MGQVVKNELNNVDGKQGERNKAEWVREHDNLHGHFDCFSGAAGDMMLAACLDAAGENKSKLLQNVSFCIEQGMPELHNEFSIETKIVQKGSGCIAGTYVIVNSIYDHEAAPVPGSDKKENGERSSAHHHAHDHDAGGEKKLNEKDGNSNADHSETHEDHSYDADHGHSHEHNHECDDNNDQNLDHLRNHEHAYSHDQDHDCIKSHDHEDSHSHDEAHDHNHEHGHGHSHKHDHEHKHSHSHSHNDSQSHDDGHHHSHSHDADLSDNHNHSHHHGHSHSHGHQHGGTRGPLRNLPQIREMLMNAPEEYIPKWVQENAIAAFTELAIAEAKTHDASSLNAVHFHEVGAIDSIVDTVGTLLALYKLGVSTVTCSRLPLGEGTVYTDHGLLPVPAPATLRLLVGMPVTGGPPGVTGELVTPTAAALLRVLTKAHITADVPKPLKKGNRAGKPPSFTLRSVGIGAGTKDFQNHPNIIRLMIGDSVVT